MKNNIDNKNVVPHRAVHLTTIDMPHLCLRTAFGKELLSYVMNSEKLGWPTMLAAKHL